MGFWGFGVLGFWGFGVLGFWGFGVLGFWGFGVLGNMGNVEKHRCVGHSLGEKYGGHGGHGGYGGSRSSNSRTMSRQSVNNSVGGKVESSSKILEKSIKTPRHSFGTVEGGNQSREGGHSNQSNQSKQSRQGRESREGRESKPGSKMEAEVHLRGV